MFIGSSSSLPWDRQKPPPVYLLNVSLLLIVLYHSLSTPPFAMPFRRLTSHRDSPGVKVVPGGAVARCWELYLCKLCYPRSFCHFNDSPTFWPLSMTICNSDNLRYHFKLKSAGWPLCLHVWSQLHKLSFQSLSFFSYGNEDASIFLWGLW